MKTTLLFALMLLFIGTTYCQEAAFDWACSYGSAEFDRVKDIAVDPDGNSYITGGYSFTIDFDPGPSEFWLTPGGSTDIFIQKLDGDGNFIWCKSIGSTGTELSDVIYADELGNIYISGYFTGTVDFDPGVGISERTSIGSGDCFILKLDIDGNFIWVKSFGDGLTDRGMAITTDEAGNIFCSGTYQGTVDFDPDLGIFDLTAEGEEDVFIQKLDEDGNFIWAKSFGGESEDRINSIQVNSAGFIYLAGTYSGTTDFDPDGGIFNLTSLGFFDDYVLKLNDEGAFEWATSIGTDLGDSIGGMEIDDDGNVYSFGHYTGTIDFDPGIAVVSTTSEGGLDIFIQKLDADGNFIWVKSIGGSDNDRAFGLESDEFGNLYATGIFMEVVDFDPSGAVSNLISAGSTDPFILKLNSEGNFIWAKSTSGAGIDDGNAITVDNFGDIYVIGEFQETMDFNPGAAEFNLESNGSKDIFVLKLNACSPDAVTDEITACISYTWTNGITYYEDNNSATQNLLNIDGCDSIVTLDLTINPVDITTTATGGIITSNAIGATYQWLDCNDGYSEIDGETSVSYTPTADGDYAVIITIDDCSDTSECVAIDGVGIDENPFSKLSIYPNPSKGQFNIDLGNLQVLSIRIYAMNGDLIYSTNDLSTGVLTFEIEVEAGIYFVDVLTETNRGQFKLVIE